MFTGSTRAAPADGRCTASIVPVTRMQLLALFKRDVWELERRAPLAMARLRALLDERRRGTPAAGSAG
jgi:hypothetical protein